MANEKRLIDANDLWQKTFVCEEPGDFRKAIENAPTVDAVEVVHGYWELSIFNHPMSFFVDHTCSVCGHMERLDICASPLKWNYCPNCGAKMDGDGNV